MAAPRATWWIGPGKLAKAADSIDSNARSATIAKLPIAAAPKRAICGAMPGQSGARPAATIVQRPQLMVPASRRAAATWDKLLSKTPLSDPRPRDLAANTQRAATIGPVANNT